MRISRLRLLGFKSFVEPTELIIERGLTGVVGPNGCGKSNLLEALRWVMGESSYKSMRGSAMDDVIFSGTNDRPSRNTAEVTMFLDNTLRKAPSDYNDVDEIEITRRIEREAGSAYRINGRESRARDVKIFFEDAATGARSPALVRQGQIGDIVNAKPESRRRILEDAAGIAGLHSRRHEAELRLRAAEGNMARLGDILGSINSQVESLKRQARQARRYKEVSGEIRRTEALLMHLNWKRAEAETLTKEHELRSAIEVLAQAAQTESQALQTEASRSEDLQPLREEEAKKSAAFGRLKVESENFEREAERAQARALELEERARQITQDIHREEAATIESTKTIERLNAEIDALTQEQNNAENAQNIADTELVQAEETFAATEQQLAELTRHIAQEDAKRAGLQQTLSENQASAARMEEKIASLATDATRIAAKAPDAQKLQETTQIGRRLANAVADIERQSSEANENVQTLSEQVKERRQAAADAHLAVSALETERKTLSRLLIPDDSGAYPAIIDSVRATPGYEAALGAALGDDLDAPAEADAAIHWRVIPQHPADPALPADTTPLANFVEAPEELNRRLRQVGVVSAIDGARLQKDLAPGQRLVSQDGDLWRWDGFVAASHSTTSAAQRLAQRNRLTAIEHEEAGAREKAATLAAEERETQQKLTAAQENDQRLRQLWRTKQSELASTRDLLTSLEQRAREVSNELATLAGTRTRCEQERIECSEKIADLQIAFEALASGVNSDVRQKLSQTKTLAQEQRTVAADKRGTKIALQREQQMRAGRLEAQRNEVFEWEGRKTRANEQLETLRARLSETQTASQEFIDLPAKLATRREQLLNALLQSDEHRKHAADALAVAVSHQKDAVQALRNAQSAVAEARESKARIEAQQEAAQHKLAEAVNTISDKLQIAPEACLTIAELPDGSEPPSLEDVQQRLTRLTADRERLGGVNLQADDELERLAEQSSSLEEERRDVEEAIAKLRSAIAQLNREGRKRLNEAFEAVDAHFQRLFSTLFGGGEARLEMIQSEEDPLEGGLEIIARPPGKKPATLSLLSGGEQTLTALSLIFAVFLTNPAPICVLDEVDAPLDDSNVDRFCTLMEKMSAETETRFLVITHHPMTMARMHRLFGVTMAERGVSQLVSVDLETARGFREAS